MSALKDGGEPWNGWVLEKRDQSLCGAPEWALGRARIDGACGRGQEPGLGWPPLKSLHPFPCPFQNLHEKECPRENLEDRPRPLLGQPPDTPGVRRCPH